MDAFITAEMSQQARSAARPPGPKYLGSLQLELPLDQLSAGPK